ncbi:MAG: hypothetical protein QG663_1568, partial [Thermodesulfobacteriota bacterium]|nr:hypothetical protein [Thermodesulfobacteriota bacterium]
MMIKLTLIMFVVAMMMMRIT